MRGDYVGSVLLKWKAMDLSPKWGDFAPQIRGFWEEHDDQPSFWGIYVILRDSQIFGSSCHMCFIKMFLALDWINPSVRSHLEDHFPSLPPWFRWCDLHDFGIRDLHGFGWRDWRVGRTGLRTGSCWSSTFRHGHGRCMAKFERSKYELVKSHKDTSVSYKTPRKNQGFYLIYTRKDTTRSNEEVLVPGPGFIPVSEVVFGKFWWTVVKGHLNPVPINSDSIAQVINEGLEVSLLTWGTVSCHVLMPLTLSQFLADDVYKTALMVCAQDLALGKNGGLTGTMWTHGRLDRLEAADTGSRYNIIKPADQTSIWGSLVWCISIAYCCRLNPKMWWFSFWTSEPLDFQGATGYLKTKPRKPLCPWLRQGWSGPFLALQPGCILLHVFLLLGLVDLLLDKSRWGGLDMPLENRVCRRWS